MSTAAVLLMVSVCGVVWGGFISLLVRMSRKERQKAVRNAVDDSA